MCSRPGCVALPLTVALTLTVVLTLTVALNLAIALTLTVALPLKIALTLTLALGHNPTHRYGHPHAHPRATAVLVDADGTLHRAFEAVLPTGDRTAVMLTAQAQPKTEPKP